MNNNPTIFKTMIDTSHEPIGIFFHYNIIYVNHAFEKLLHCLDDGKFINKHLADISPPKQPDGKDSRQKAEKILALAYEQDFYCFEWLYKRNGGSKFMLNCSLSKLLFEDKQFLLARWQDVRKIKQCEENLQKARKEIDQLMQAKSDFVAHLSHEIRTPLNTFVGLTELLKSFITDEVQLKELKAIKTTGKSLLNHINDILDFAKIDAGMMQIEECPINPRNILKEIEQIFQFKLPEKNLDLILDIDEDLPLELLMDKFRIRQVLVNLISNAIHFTDHGYIKLSAQPIYKQVHHNKLDLIITVEDSGIGIPESEKDLIFQSFKQQTYQRANDYGGTGLGLALSKKLMEMMRGSIEVKSKSGQGSRFIITFYNVKIASTENNNLTISDINNNELSNKERIIETRHDNKREKSLSDNLPVIEQLKQISSKDPEQWAQLKKNIDLELKPILISFDGVIKISDVNKAAFILQELARKYQLKELQQIAHRLAHFAKSIDIININKMVTDFLNFL